MWKYYIILLSSSILALGCTGDQNKNQLKSHNTCKAPPSMEDVFDKRKEKNNRCFLLSFFDEPCISKNEGDPNSQTIRFSIYNSYSNTFIIRIDKSDFCQRLVIKEIPSAFFNLIYFSEGRDLVNYKTYSCNVDERFWNNLTQFFSKKEKLMNDQLYIDGTYCYIEIKTKTNYFSVTKTMPFSNDLSSLDIFLNRIIKQVQDHPNDSISTNIDSL